MPSMWSAHDDCRARGKGRSPRLLDLQVSNLHAVRKIRSGGLRARRFTPAGATHMLTVSPLSAVLIGTLVLTN